MFGFGAPATSHIRVKVLSVNCKFSTGRDTADLVTNLVISDSTTLSHTVSLICMAQPSSTSEILKRIRGHNKCQVEGF